MYGEREEKKSKFNSRLFDGISIKYSYLKVDWKKNSHDNNWIKNNILSPSQAAYKISSFQLQEKNYFMWWTFDKQITFHIKYKIVGIRHQTFFFSLLLDREKLFLRSFYLPDIISLFSSFKNIFKVLLKWNKEALNTFIDCLWTIIFFTIAVLQKLLNTLTWISMR